MPNEPSAMSMHYQRIADAFVAYCRQPVGTSLAALFGDNAIRAIESSARASAKKTSIRCSMYLASALMAAIALWLAWQPFPFLGSLILSGACIFMAGSALRWSRQREEPTVDILEVGATPEQVNHLRILESFRNRLANGQFLVEQRMPDGTTQPFSQDQRRSFAADHGRVLIVRNDQSLRMRIRSRPVPLSDIWVSLGGSVSASLITSRTLIDVEDPILFDRWLKWFSDHATGSGRDAVAFRRSLRLIVFLRRPDIRPLSLEKKVEMAENDPEEKYTQSQVEKVHAGIYEPFIGFLRHLPLNEIP